MQINLNAYFEKKVCMHMHNYKYALVHICMQDAY